MQTQEITPIKCELPQTLGNNIQIYVLSDVHIGDPHCDMDVLK